ncbi:Serine/threonine-protein kinase ppk15 [Smittium culicis]|uniref:Serine/threonine-protein kinase ppk15 n=1 Tax=Smittium culicis TaxID=133412 RepID=A0A1R1XZB7_9FUNG|nr:Serine/threonine-protein kinase ppk15 [Smittium culicis]
MSYNDPSPFLKSHNLNFPMRKLSLKTPADSPTFHPNYSPDTSHIVNMNSSSSKNNTSDHISTHQSFPQPQFFSPIPKTPESPKGFSLNVSHFSSPNTSLDNPLTLPSLAQDSPQPNSPQPYLNSPKLSKFPPSTKPRTASFSSSNYYLSESGPPIPTKYSRKSSALIPNPSNFSFRKRLQSPSLSNDLPPNIPQPNSNNRSLMSPNPPFDKIPTSIHTNIIKNDLASSPSSNFKKFHLNSPSSQKIDPPNSASINQFPNIQNQTSYDTFYKPSNLNSKKNNQFSSDKNLIHSEFVDYTQIPMPPKNSENLKIYPMSAHIDSKKNSLFDIFPNISSLKSSPYISSPSQTSPHRSQNSTSNPHIIINSNHDELVDSFENHLHIYNNYSPNKNNIEINNTYRNINQSPKNNDLDSYQKQYLQRRQLRLRSVVGSRNRTLKPLNLPEIYTSNPNSDHDHDHHKHSNDTPIAQNYQHLSDVHSNKKLLPPNLVIDLISRNQPHQPISKNDQSLNHFTLKNSFKANDNLKSQSSKNLLPNIQEKVYNKTVGSEEDIVKHAKRSYTNGSRLNNDKHSSNLVKLTVNLVEIYEKLHNINQNSPNKPYRNATMNTNSNIYQNASTNNPLNTNLNIHQNSFINTNLISNRNQNYDKNLSSNLHSNKTVSHKNNQETNKAANNKNQTSNHQPTQQDILANNQFLTEPNKGAYNFGYDNVNFNLILRVSDVIGINPGQQYQVIGNLGSGTFGQVVKCKNILKNSIYAVKIIKNKPAYYNQSLNEITMLQKLNKNEESSNKSSNKHFVELIESFTFKSHLVIVYEPLNFNLYELLKRKSFSGLQLHEIHKISTQILSALQVLKYQKIIHSDLKPENIMVDSIELLNVKIIDFGSSCFESNTLFNYIQSRFYRSIEVVLELKYDCGIDMWSFGCIASELFFGVPIFPANSEHDLLLRIIKLLGMPDKRILESVSPKKKQKFFIIDKYNNYFLKPIDANPSSTSAENDNYYDSTAKNNLTSNKNSYKTNNDQKMITIPDLIFAQYRNQTKSRSIPIQVHKFADLLLKILKIDQNKRYSPTNALNHSFFKDFHLDHRYINTKTQLANDGIGLINSQRKTYSKTPIISEKYKSPGGSIKNKSPSVTDRYIPPADSNKYKSSATDKYNSSKISDTYVFSSESDLSDNQQSFSDSKNNLGSFLSATSSEGSFSKNIFSPISDASIISEPSSTCNINHSLYPRNDGEFIFSSENSNSSIGLIPESTSNSNLNSLDSLKVSYEHIQPDSFNSRNISSSSFKKSSKATSLSNSSQGLDPLYNFSDFSNDSIDSRVKIFSSHNSSFNNIFPENISRKSNSSNIATNYNSNIFSNFNTNSPFSKNDPDDYLIRQHYNSSNSFHFNSSNNNSNSSNFNNVPYLSQQYSYYNDSKYASVPSNNSGFISLTGPSVFESSESLSYLDHSNNPGIKKSNKSLRPSSSQFLNSQNKSLRSNHTPKRMYFKRPVSPSYYSPQPRLDLGCDQEN